MTVNSKDNGLQSDDFEGIVIHAAYENSACDRVTGDTPLESLQLETCMALNMLFEAGKAIGIVIPHEKRTALLSESKTIADLAAKLQFIAQEGTEK